LPRSISTNARSRPFGHWKPLPQGDMLMDFACPLLRYNKKDLRRANPAEVWLLPITDNCLLYSLPAATDFSLNELCSMRDFLAAACRAKLM